MYRRPFVIQKRDAAVPADHFGLFVASIPAPLGIGKVELENSKWLSGFLCENYALSKARDISEYGGWRNYCLSLGDDVGS